MYYIMIGLCIILSGIIMLGMMLEEQQKKLDTLFKKHYALNNKLVNEKRKDN